jgi:hypothetical protein
MSFCAKIFIKACNETRFFGYMLRGGKAVKSGDMTQIYQEHAQSVFQISARPFPQ